MPYFEQALSALIAAAVLLVAFLVLQPAMVRTRRGRIFAFGVFALLPLVVSALGLSRHLEASKSTEFCLSCHVMEPYGRSLLIDDPEFLPAQHYQNRRIDRDHACFTCHTQYAMFGDLKAKLNGLRHVWINFVGTPPAPEDIELYEPYNNRECLHCHAGARSFEEDELHAELRAELAANEMSCLECHASVHEVHRLEELSFWQEESP